MGSPDGYEIGISEFTLGYAFLFEQTQASWSGLRAAPILPSLQHEEQHGWDAKLPVNGTDFYYQFKLSDYLSRGNARYIQDGTYNRPYYRFSLHRRNNNRQHQRLRRHRLTNPNTYYVAPQFNSIEEFNSRFLAWQITGSSRIIPLTLCDDVADGDWHCITFQRDNAAWTFHSEPRWHERSYTGKDLEHVYRSSSYGWHRIGLDFVGGLLERTRAAPNEIMAEEEPEQARRVRSLPDEAIAGHEGRDLLLRTADILSTTLRVTLVLVGSRE
jgi:hypothetical protein